MKSHDPTYPLFPTFAFLAFVFCLIPLPWHVRAWNSGTCAYMIWTATACLIEFVNSLVWRGNVLNIAPIWCDISSKLLIGASVGIPAATLCISQRLYKITSAKSVSVTREDKKRMIVVDVAISLGIPSLIMILHVVVQPHRFDILEDIGCYPVIYNTLPAYFLYFMWPVALGLVSFVFSGLTLRTFWMRRAQFNQLLSSNSLNSSRYLRLTLLALIDMMCTVPLAIYSVYIANKGVGLAPWVSWEETHFDFGHVVQVAAFFWRSDPSFEISVELTRWLPVFSAFVFFALFGFASEAQKRYAMAFAWVRKVVGLGQLSTQAKQSKHSLSSWKPLNGNQRPSKPSFSFSDSAKLKNDTLSSEETEVELQVYPQKDDIEKSAGLNTPSSYGVPPAYSALGRQPESQNMHSYLYSPSQTTLESKPSQSSLRTATSNDRVYVSDCGPDAGRTRSPSPAPFSGVIPIPLRPSTPPNIFTATSASSSPHAVEVVRVTVQTQSDTIQRPSRP